MSDFSPEGALSVLSGFETTGEGDFFGLGNGDTKDRELFSKGLKTLFSRFSTRSAKLSSSAEPFIRHKRSNPISAFMRGEELLFTSAIVL